MIDVVGVFGMLVAVMIIPALFFRAALKDVPSEVAEMDDLNPPAELSEGKNVAAKNDWHNDPTPSATTDDDIGDGVDTEVNRGAW